MQSTYLWPSTVDASDSGLSLATYSVADLAKEFGTPLYLFDETTLRNAARAMVDGLAAYQAGTSIYYACKALLNTAVVQLLADEGLCFDVVSLNELAVVCHAGVDASRCHLHGNGTPPAELAAAVAMGIGRIVVDNHNQLQALIEITEAQAVTQDILLRIAPDVIAGGNEKIQTGASTSKFGFNIANGAALQAIKQAHAAPSLNLIGIHAHSGSQIRSFDALRETIRRLFALAETARQKYGWHMREVSPGGGLAVPINGEQSVVATEDYCAALVETTTAEAEKRGWKLPHLSIEPGRSLVARAGVAVYTVTGTKPLEEQADYLHVDGGVGDNLRPAMYGAVYNAVCVNRPNLPLTTTYQIAGRYCESGDILIPQVRLPEMGAGDLLALPAAGAYTLSMASNYNGIGRPAVLLLNNGQARLIQRRETWRDIIGRDG